MLTPNIMPPVNDGTPCSNWCFHPLKILNVLDVLNAAANLRVYQRPVPSSSPAIAVKMDTQNENGLYGFI